MKASATFPSLQSLCEASLAKLVDAHNFADILAYGEALNCTFLSNYCKKFLLLNLDAILAASRPRELGILRFQTSVGMIGSEHEEEVLEFFEENKNSNESPRLHPAPLHCLYQHNRQKYHVLKNQLPNLSVQLCGVLRVFGRN